jgi:hypothetical protein
MDSPSQTRPISKQIARRTDIIQIFDELCRRSFAVKCDNSRNLRDRLTILFDRHQQFGSCDLPFSLQHTIDGPVAVFQKILGHERGAMAPDKNKRVRQFLLGQLRQIHDLRNIRQVITAERHGVGLPGPD